ncbi:MAG: adenine deaminase [Actinobacteria bacterium]|nr:adenine deaminase [Actinomycetota bacterium]
MENDTWLAVARGEGEADLVFTGARVVDVFSGRVREEAVAVHGGRIAGFGSRRARERVELDGAFLCPAFIDGHVHIESSLVSLPEYARAVVPHGTAAVVTDYHEIANVMGLEGVRYMMRLAEGLPLEVFVMLPSCVPATPMETAGAVLEAEDLAPLLAEEAVVGLGEVMNFPGVIAGDASVMAKIALCRGLPVDGHAPGLGGERLDAYIAAGVESDHECVESGEAWEKLERGMYIYVREGSTARNLQALLPLALESFSHRLLLVTDDRQPDDLMRQGHLDHVLRRAVGLGLDPVKALRMVTLHPAMRFRLPRRGGIAPGWQADLVVLEDLEDFTVREVYKRGRRVAAGGELLVEASPGEAARGTMNVAWEKIPGIGVAAEKGDILVIGVVPDQIVTERLAEKPRVEKGMVVSDPQRDILKICVFERHRGTGNVGVGFIRGFGLREGAMASTVAHDSHNLVVLGVEDGDILAAARRVVEMGGGQAAVRGGEVLAELPLDVAGLMSTLPLAKVAERVRQLREAVRGLGCALSDPFMALSFMALPVIPALKITDRGLFDVESFRHVPLFVS